jgi:hypothetical protein
VLLNALLMTEHNAFPVLEDVENNKGLRGLVTRAGGLLGTSARPTLSVLLPLLLLLLLPFLLLLLLGLLRSSTQHALSLLVLRASV